MPRPAPSRTRQLICAVLSCSLLSLLIPFSTAADLQVTTDLRQATEQTIETIQSGVQSQQKIDQIDDQTQLLLARYKNQLRQLESLNTYNRQLGELVKQQQIEQQRLEDEIQRIVQTEREILPLVERMISALEQFIALDIPFLTEQRSQRVAALKALIQRPDISIAEKFRRVMETYQVENDYGRTLEAYKGALVANEQNGQPIHKTVDYLKIGRVVLIYNSLDGEETALWNQAARSWQPIDPSQLSRTEIKHAFQVARKQAPPDLLMLPVPAPQKWPEKIPGATH